MPQPKTPPRHPPVDVLTIPEAARFLRCSEMHVYRLIAAGDLEITDISVSGSPSTKSRVRADSIADFLNRRTQKTAS